MVAVASDIPLPSADSFDLGDAPQDLSGRWGIIVLRASNRPRSEDAEIIDTADHQLHPVFPQQGKQPSSHRLLQQSETTSEEDQFNFDFAEQLFADFNGVNGQADRRDHALVFQIAKGSLAAFQQLRAMLVSIRASARLSYIVDIQNVDAVEAKALIAVLDRTHDGVVGKIKRLLERQGAVKVVGDVWRIGVGR